MKAVITNLLLISHGYSLPREERLKIGITDELIRLAPGIEDRKTASLIQTKPLTRSIKEKVSLARGLPREFTTGMVLAHEKPYERAGRNH